MWVGVTLVLVWGCSLVSPYADFDDEDSEYPDPSSNNVDFYDTSNEDKDGVLGRTDRNRMRRFEVSAPTTDDDDLVRGILQQLLTKREDVLLSYGLVSQSPSPEGATRPNLANMAYPGIKLPVNSDNDSKDDNTKETDDDDNIYSNEPKKSSIVSSDKKKISIEDSRKFGYKLKKFSEEPRQFNDKFTQFGDEARKFSDEPRQFNDDLKEFIDKLRQIRGESSKPVEESNPSDAYMTSYEDTSETDDETTKAETDSSSLDANDWSQLMLKMNPPKTYDGIKRIELARNNDFIHQESTEVTPLGVLREGNGTDNTTGDITANQNDITTMAKTDRATTDQPSNTNTDQSGNTTLAQTDRATTDQPGNITAGQVGNANTAQTDRPTTDQPENTTADRISNTTVAQTNRATTDQSGDTTTDQSGDTTTDQSGDTTANQNGKTTVDQSLTTANNQNMNATTGGSTINGTTDQSDVGSSTKETTTTTLTTSTTSTITTTTSTTSTTTAEPKLDINALVEILRNLTYDYDTNLTEVFNMTLQKYRIPTCATPEPPTTTTTTTSTTTTTTTTTTPTPGYDYETNATGTIMGKCFVCGLEDTEIPRNAFCADAFAGDFIPLVPVDYTARGHLAVFRKYCRFMDIPKYHVNASDPRSIWGRWTGGCSVRWIDLSGVYTQRACRNRNRALMGKHFVSKRMAKLEMSLQHVENGCIISPMASLVPLSRGISLFARFHACVCTGSWCNAGSRLQPAKWTLIAVCCVQVLRLLRWT